MKQLQIQSPLWRATGAITVASLFVPLAGCGAPAPQQSNSGFQPQNQRQMQAPQQGMSTRQKGTLLAGAAAMYFLYRKYQRDNAAKLQQARAAAPNGQIQFYRSKLGGYIYYRDPQTKQAIRVTPPLQNVGTIQVPQQQAQEYQKFQGYNNQSSGETLDRYFPVQ